MRVSPELEGELRQAIADIESGNYLELTPHQLKELAATGELRMLDEWLGRIARLTPGFRRALHVLGIVPGSTRRLALASAIAALSDADVLPSRADFLTDFRPERAYVRRVAGQNLWLLPLRQ